MTLSPFLWEQKSSSLGRDDDDAFCVLCVVVVALLSLVGGVLVAGCRRSLINVDRGKNFKVICKGKDRECLRFHRDDPKIFTK